MYWTDKSGAYAEVKEDDIGWKEYCSDPACPEGALAWLGVLWKIKQGCWYPSADTEQEAGQAMLQYWEICSFEVA
eukprot:6911809-Alexandrium_andersonii.AAC.1